MKVDGAEFRRAIRECVVPFMAETKSRHFIMDGLRTQYTAECQATMARCRHNGRRYPITCELPASMASNGFPPRSHDCNPLETAFAMLQNMVGNHFRDNPDDYGKLHVLHAKVAEFWPLCADLLRDLIIGQMRVMK